MLLLCLWTPGRWPSRSRGLAAAAWNLGSEPGLSVAGVDWGGSSGCCERGGGPIFRPV